MRYCLLPLVACSLATIANAQNYSYSGSMSGSAAIVPDGGYGGTYVDFRSVSDQFTYNAAANTLTDVSTITVSPSGGDFNTYQLGAQNVLGSMDFTVGNNGTFTIDRTFNLVPNPILPNGWEAVGQDYDVPVSGTATYGGQSFTGNWQYDLPETGIFTLQITPSEISIYNDFGGLEDAGGPPVGGALGLNYEDMAPGFTWTRDEVARLVTPSNVPETGSWAVNVLAVGAIALGVLRYRKPSDVAL